MMNLLRKKFMGLSRWLVIPGIFLLCYQQTRAQVGSLHHGNLIVCSPTGGLNVGSVVKLYQFTPSGSIVDSVVIPSTGANELTVSGSASSEGFITLSAEKDRIILVGYSASAGTASVASSTVNRVIGTIDSTETYVLQYSQPVFSGQNARGGTSYGNNFFESGSSGGIYYMNTASNIENSPISNCRNINIYAGNMYATSGSGTNIGINQISVVAGNGISTATGQTATLLTTTGASSPYGFSISPNGLTAYMADATNGIVKYTRTTNSGAFTLAYTVYATACEGICVDYTTSPTTPIIYATLASGLSLISMTDNGSTLTYSGITRLDTTVSTQPFRGVTFAPSVAATISGGTSICSGGNTTITFTGNPHGLITYSVNGTPATIQLDSAFGQATLNTGALTSSTTYTLGSETTPFGTTAVSGSTTVTISTLPAIAGNTTTCAGFTATNALTDATPGGTWSSSNSGVATIGTGGVVTGVSAGSAIISYSMGGTCYTTTTETILPALNTISLSNANLCALSTATVTITGATGTWSSGTNSVATVGSTTGVVTGVASGSDIITFTSTAGCYTTTTETVISASAGTLSGFTIVCLGSSTSLSSSVPGGTWTSSNSSIAPIGGTTGLVNGLATGAVTITYSLTTACGSYSAYYPMTVVNTFTVPTPVVTPAVDYLCPGSPAQMVYAAHDSTTGSVTLSSSTASFTIPVNAADSSSINVTGVPAGATITGVSVTLNVGNTSGAYQSDNAFNLRAPDGSIINLDNFHGSSGNGFTNVTFSSAGTLAQSSATLAAGNLYIASLVSGSPTSGSYTTTTYRSNSTSWSSLYATPNGQWTLLTDNNYNATEDTFKNWSITINYAIVPTVTWSPLTGLYSNTSGTSYTGANTNTVYAQPASTTTYTVTANMGGCTSSATTVMNFAPSIPSISGPSGTCVSSSASLTDIATGGTWSSSAAGIASVGSTTGVVTGVSTGTTIITYAESGCIVTTTETIVAAMNPITNGGSLCAMTTTTLGDLTPSGTWSSSNPAVASINASTGSVSGLAGGTSVITYTSPVGCLAMVTETVSPLPIIGNPGTCIGSSTNLGDATSGGTWTSSSTAIATVGSSTGVVTGIGAGTTLITYQAPGGCITSTTETVFAAILPVSGGGSLCATFTTTLGDATPGGTWYSSNTSIATIGSGSGAITGVNFGTVLVTYTSPVGCTTTTTETILPNSVSPISGSPYVCLGASVQLSDNTPGGTWSSGSPMANVNSTSGVVTGMAFGTSLMSYTLTNTCGTFTATYPITITTLTVPTPVITPALASLCPSSPADQLYAYGDTITNTFTATATPTGIPWETANNADSIVVPISSIPAGAVVTGVSVTFLVTPASTGTIYESDNGFNLKAPNGNIINLDNFKGANSCACGFANVTISSAGTTALPTTTLQSGIPYQASLAAVGNPTAMLPAADRSNATTWSSLYSMPNGNWTLLIDNKYSTGEDTLKNCSVTITYVLTPSVTWSPASGLFTNTAGTAAYTGTSTSTVYTLPGATTVYTVTANMGGCTSSASVSALVNPTLYVPGINGASAECVGTTTILTDSTTGGTWTSSNSAVATAGSLTGIVTGVSGGSATITYNYNSGSCSGYAVKSFTVNSLPVLPGISGSTTLCLSSSTVTLLSDGSLGGTWSSTNPAVATIGLTSGVVNAVTTGNTLISYSYSNGTCSNYTTTTVTVASSPSAVTITPNEASVCTAGSPAMLVASGGSIPGSSTASSGTISFSIPNSAAGVTTSLTVSGVPAGATVTGISVNYNATESFDGDLELNLRAPNASVINLFSSGTSNSGANFVNTTISSAGTTIIPNLASGAPWTGVWAASNAIIDGAGALVGSSVYSVTTTSWAPLESANPNGTWVLVGRDNYSGNSATLTSWSLTVNYTYQVPVTWLPVAGLYTNTAGTTPYTLGTNSNTVYALPATTTLYTATGSNGACVSSGSVNVHSSSSLYIPVINGSSVLCMGTNNTLTDSTAGGTWSSSNIAVATVGTGSGVVTPVGTGSAVITYSYSNGACTGNAYKNVTVNGLPAVAGIGGAGNLCSGTTMTLTDATTGGVWSSGAPAIVTVGATGMVTPVTPGTAMVYYTYSNGTCSNTASAVVTSINMPTPISITPASSAICAGGPSDMLVATGGMIPGTVTASSTSAPFFEGDFTDASVSPITISGIPAGSIITGVSVTINVGAKTSAYQSDNILNLEAPNGNIINLDYEGGIHAGGYGFSNVMISSFGTTPIGTAQLTSAINYQASLQVGQGPTAPVDLRSTTSTWSDLYSSPNGTWTFVPTNDYSATEDTFNNWSITINYLAPVPTTWASASGLFIDAAATTSYSGASTDTVYAIPASTTVYTVTATNVTCTSSSMANVVVNPVPSVFGGSSAVCIGQTTTLSDALLGGSWNSGNTTVATIGIGSGIVSGISQGTAAVTYSILSTGCSTVGTVTVNPLPNIYTVTGGGAYCAGMSGVHDSLNGSDAGVNYMLYHNDTLVAGPISGSGSAIDFGSFTVPGDYTVAGMNATTGCQSDMTGRDSISVNALPFAYNVTGTGSYCSGSTGVDIMLSGSNMGIRYQLYNNGSALGSPMGGVAGVLDFGAQTDSGTYSVIAMDTVTMCTNNMHDTATVTILPLPASHTVIGGGSFCPGGTGVTIGLNGSDPGKSYWLYIGGTLTGSSVAGTGDSISFGLHGVTGIYTIVARDTTTLCTSNMNGSDTISLRSLPVVFDVTGTGSYCSGGTGLTVGLDNSVMGVNYQLYFDGSSSGAAVMGTGSAIGFGLHTSAGTYQVMAMDTTTTCSAVMNDSAIISINPLPGIHNVTGGGGYCQGGTGVTIGLNGSDTGINYQLYMGIHSIGSTLSGTGSTLSFGLDTAAGVYKVVAVNFRTSCVNNMTDSAIVSINDTPNTYTVTETNAGAYCAGGTGVHVGLSNSDTGTNYRLYYAGSPIGASLSGTDTALDFGLHTAAGVYTAVATNSRTLCTSHMASEATISITPLPNAYNVIGGGSYCAGGTGVHIMLRYSDLGNVYQLYLGGSAVGSPLGGTGSLIDFGADTARGIYTIMAIDTTTTCMNMMTGRDTIVVSPIVTPSVTIAASAGDTICQGAHATFNASISNGGSTPIIHWKLYGFNVGTDSTSYSYYPANGDVVTAMLVSNAACASSDTATSDTIVMVVDTNRTPTIHISVTPTSNICMLTPVTFNSAVTYGGPTPGFNWLVNGVSSGTASTFTYTPAIGDVVSCTLTSDYACKLVTTVNSSDIALDVVAPIVPSVVINAYPGLNIAKYQRDSFVAVVTNGGSPLYQWYINHVAVPGATSEMFAGNSFNNHDSVSCLVTRTDACGLSTFNGVFLNVSTVGVPQVTAGNPDVMIIPNPSKGEFQIKGSFGNIDDQEVNIEITDLLGQVIYSSKAAVKNGEINEKITLNNNLANGMYILNLHSSQVNNVFHIVIEQ